MYLPVLDQQIEAISRVMSTFDSSSLSGKEAADLVERFARLEKLAGAGKSLCAKRVADTGYYGHEGARDAGSWLAGVTGESRTAANDAIETANSLDLLPGLDEAFRSGELSGKQAHEVARAGALDPDSEDALLRTARSTSLGGLRQVADEVAAAARSKEEDEERHRRVHEDRHLRTWSTRDGAFAGRFSLTPEAGALLMGPLERLADAIFAQAWREGRHECHDAYLADALVCLATGDWLGDEEQSQPYADADSANGEDASPMIPAPTSGPEPSAGACDYLKPERSERTGVDSSDTTVETAALTASGAPGHGASTDPGARRTSAAASSLGPVQGSSPAAGPAPPPGKSARPGGRDGRTSFRPDYTVIMRIDLQALVRGHLLPGEECSIDGVGHVPISVVQRYLDVAKIRLVVTDGVEIRSIFSFKRTIGPALDTALHHRDRTCVVPGCTSTFHLERDHVREFAKKGPTTLSNLVLLCPYHHRLKTNKGFRIEGVPGSWRWLKPDGSVAGP